MLNSSLSLPSKVNTQVNMLRSSYDITLRLKGNPVDKSTEEGSNQPNLLRQGPRELL